MDTLFIIAPAYNEAENIGRFVAEWYPVIEKYNADAKSRLVIINDGSKDQTAHILDTLKTRYPLLLPLTKENGGHGDTVLYGYHFALSHGADYVFQTDSDGQTDPKEFEQFWEARHHYNALFGMRTKRGDGTSRMLIEKVLCMILKVYFKVDIPDANAPFRLMSAEYLNKYLPLIPEHFNLPNVLLTMLGKYFNEPIRFIEISFAPRQGGVNSINIKKIVKIGQQALIDFAKIRRSLEVKNAGEKMV